MKEKTNSLDIFKVLVVGPLEVNCYILGSRETGEGIIIDPGDEGERILAEVKSSGLRVKYILNTHTHPDHTGGNWFLMKKTRAGLLIHQLDEELLRLTYPSPQSSPPRGEEERGIGRDRTPSPQSSPARGEEGAYPSPLAHIRDGNLIQVGGSQLKVIHTPGHTKGGVCFLCDGWLFSGDTLFAGSIGRTDLPGGSYEELITSVREKLFPLRDDIEVFPGHGPSTTIEIEKRENPFFI